MSECDEEMGLLTKFRYLTIHCVSFGIFGIMCVGYMIVIPIVFLAYPDNRFRRYYINQSFTHIGFKFVVWFCDKVGFITIKFMNPDQKHLLKPILVANHLSMFDIVAIFCYFPGYVTFVHRKFLKNPILYPMIKSCGYIPVNPSDPTDRQRAIAEASEYLKNGLKLVIFPEGKRSKDGRLGTFQSGAFYLSVVNKVGISFAFFTCDRAFLNNQKMFIARKKPINLNVWLMPGIDRVSELTKRKTVKELKKKSELLYDDWMKSDRSLPWNKIQDMTKEIYR